MVWHTSSSPIPQYNLLSKSLSVNKSNPSPTSHLYRWWMTWLRDFVTNFWCSLVLCWNAIPSLQSISWLFWWVLEVLSPPKTLLYSFSQFIFSNLFCWHGKPTLSVKILSTLSYQNLTCPFVTVLIWSFLLSVISGLIRL
jgi:hypothetical protein